MIEIQPIDADAGTPPTPTERRSLGRRLRRWPITLYIGGTLVSLFVLVALVSFVWTPYPPNQLNLTNRLASPGTPGFPLGTDRAGRDVVTELMLGARNSLYVSVVSTVVAMVVGATIGLIDRRVAPPRARSVDAPRRRRARVPGHPDRPRPGRQVGGRQHHRDRSRSSFGRCRSPLVSRSARRAKCSPSTSSRRPTGTGDAGRT